MARITPDLLSKCTGQAKKKKEESLDQYLRRITHLYCSEKGIEKIVSGVCTLIAIYKSAISLQYFRRVYRSAAV